MLAPAAAPVSVPASEGRALRIRAFSFVVHRDAASSMPMRALSPAPLAPQASKFALRGLFEALSQELYTRRILLTLAFPPDTDTPMLAGACAVAGEPPTQLVTRRRFRERRLRGGGRLRWRYHADSLWRCPLSRRPPDA